MRKLKFEKNRPLRFAIYARMSTDAQNPRSPEQQINTIRDELKRQGLTWVEIRIYQDAGITGRVLSKRPGFVGMLEDIRKGNLQVDLILLDTSERLGRSEDITCVRRFLKKHGVLLADAKNHFADPTTSEGELFAAIDTWRGTQESEVKGHMVRRGKQDALEQGLWVGGPPPTGYELQVAVTERRAGRTVERCKLVPNPVTRLVIERAFQLADENGMGSSLIAKNLNNDPAVTQTLKPFNANTINRILGNRIYVGEMIWQRNSTGYVDDVRVVEPNPVEEWKVFPDYCEPLVVLDRFDRVQELRLQRRLAALRSREPGPKPSNNGLRGVALKYAPSGLVDCSVCGHAMVASRRKQSENHPGSPVAYRCSHVSVDSCSNRTEVPLDWLMDRVMALITSRLFVGSDSVTAGVCSNEISNSETFREFRNLVESEIARLDVAQPSERESLLAEQKSLEAKQAGWLESLSGDLHPTLRQAVQDQFTAAASRIDEIKFTLSHSAAICQTLSADCSPERVADIINRLGTVLLRDNPSETNLELAKHIHTIRVTDDGKIQIRMCKLGFLLTAASMQLSTSPSSPANNGFSTQTPRRTSNRPRRLIEGDETKPWDWSLRPDYSLNPRRFDHLSDDWFWVDEFDIPLKLCWSAERAIEVANSRLAEPCGLEALAKRFGVSKPTIEVALKNAKSLGVDATKIDGRKLHRNRARDHAQEVAKYFRQPGATMSAAVKHFGKSDAWLRKACKFAEGFSSSEGEPNDDAGA